VGVGARGGPRVEVGVALWLGSGSDFAEEPVRRNESRPRGLKSRFLVSSRTL